MYSKKRYATAVWLACAFALAVASRSSAAEVETTADGTVSAAASAASRIVSVGGGVTEIVYALGSEQRLVGVDTSSVYPDAATRLPQVGYQRTLSAEGIVSLRPTLVLATADVGPPAALDQVRAAGIPIRIVRSDATVEGATARIREVAAVLGRRERGEELVRSLQADLAAAAALRPEEAKRPRVLFIYARGPGTVNVSGTATAADEMIVLAGGTNAIREFEGFRPLTPEAAVTAKPDVLLLPTRGLESLGGPTALFQLPGVALTPAAQERRVVSMDDLYLLGFGPRLGQAVQELARQLHPELQGRAAPAAAAVAERVAD